MCRTLALLILIGFIAGCTTRYGSNPSGGPFARKPKPDTDTLIPAAPLANNSPLALGTPLQPGLAVTDENPIVPPRPPESTRLAGGDSVPAALPTCGRENGADSAAAFPPRARRNDPQPDQLPSPFAPKNPSGVVPAGGVAAPVTPPGPSLAALNIAEVKKLATIAAEKWAKVDTYEAIVTRRELTPAKEMSEDTVLYQYRKEPMSVFIKNIGESGKGRELLYNPNKHGDKIYVMVGKGDSILPAGIKVPPVSPDDPRVRERSRYSIREAGLGTPIGKVASWVAKAESGKIPADALTFLGSVDRKEYPYPLIGVSLKLRPGDEATMPNGGMRQWFFDPKTDSGSFGWPVLIVATEPGGKEVEYYLFEKVKPQVRLTDADFAPERLGRK
ncbi:MAG TPA: DUF1571 domain-containing protein [Gemmata sp.]|nr:DUF1571 domain-containing protein [Gemmata sp.]